MAVARTPTQDGEIKAILRRLDQMEREGEARDAQQAKISSRLNILEGRVDAVERESGALASRLGRELEAAKEAGQERTDRLDDHQAGMFGLHGRLSKVERILEGAVAALGEV